MEARELATNGIMGRCWREFLLPLYLDLGLGPLLKDDPAMPDEAASTGLHCTAFTVSIDAKRHGVTTGISASDRAKTIRAAIDAQSSAGDFARPGHLFPLRSRAGGVLERRGHTEAAVDLARLAGLSSSGVICEILNEDGTMARVPDLVRFCERHDLKMITIADLVQYRLESEFGAPENRPKTIHRSLVKPVKYLVFISLVAVL